MNYPRHILVTGASGFLGQDLVPEVLHQDFTTHILLRPATFSPFPPHPKLIVHRGDMTDVKSLIKAIRHVDAVIHLAANKYHPIYSYPINVGGAENLKHAMLHHHVKRLINISTQATKIKHKGVYGLTKLKSDQILHDPKIFQVTTLKPSLVYGPDQTSLFQTIATYIQKLPIVPVFGNGNWTMYPIWVHDVSLAIVRCLKDPRTFGKTYDLGGKEKTTMNALIDLIARTLGKPARKFHIPTPIGLIGAHTLRLFSDNPKVTVDNILGSTQSTHCHPQRAIRALRLNPLSVKAGVQQILLGDKHQVKVAIVGLGKMGLMHTAILNLLPQAKIVALIDSNPGLRQTAKTLGIPASVYPSLPQALAAGNIDLVFLCTPTYTHPPLAKWCLKHQLHLFIEKPVTTSFTDTKTLLSLSRRYLKLIVGTGYYYRYRPLYRHAKKLLRQGALGKLTSFSSTVFHGEVFGPKRGWLFDPQKSGGGVLINPTPHLLSVLVDYFGLPETISCITHQRYSTLVEDEAETKFVYKNNFFGEVQASWSRPHIPVLQTQLTIRGKSGQLTLASDKLTLKLNHRRPTTVTAADVLSPQSVVNLNPAQGAEGYFFQDQDVINSIIRKRQPKSNLRFAAKIEHLIAACYQSAKTHHPVSL